MTRKEAQLRNWQKARLMGFFLDSNGLTATEKPLFKQLMAIRKELLEKWDDESNKITAKPLAKYQCWCGKRTNVLRLNPFPYGDKIYLCKQHKEDQDGNDRK